MLPQATSLLGLMATFDSQEVCNKKLEELRWGGKPECPYKGCSCTKVYPFKDGKRYKCSQCRRIFTATTGTIFEGSHIPLKKWFAALYLASSHKKGISASQLARDIAVTYKTAYFMVARLQQAYINLAPDEMEMTVELDETYVGGKARFKHKNKRVKGAQGRGDPTKTKVFGMLERESGRVKSCRVKDVSAETLLPIVAKNVKKGAVICTDEWGAYNALGQMSYQHHFVEHGKGQYVNGEAHTNTLEGYWGTGVKRMISGVHHSISGKHINRYLAGSDFRYNSRHMTEGNRFDLVLANVHGRLKYKQLIQKI